MNFTECAFAEAALPLTASEGAATFQRILLEGSKRFIPSGCRKEFTPGLTREVIDLQEERDWRRSKDPADPAIERLNREINTQVWKEKRQR